MVEYISDLEELKKILDSGAPTIRILLRQQDIESWRKDGRFKFLKSQLENIHNLKFACTTLENGDCAYYFIAPTHLLKIRITQMLFLLTVDNRTPIVKLDPSKDIEVPYSGCTQDFSPLRAEGTLKACPLF